MSEEKVTKIKIEVPAASEIEDIIAALWTIVFTLLWAHNAPSWSLWVIGIKTLSHYWSVIFFSVRELIGRSKP